MTAEYQQRKELVINGTCDDFREQLDNVPPAMWVKLRERLKMILSKNMDQHIKPLIDDLASGGTGDVPGVDVAKYATSVSTGGTAKNAMLIAWDEWKESNDSKKKYGDKSAWEHWKAEIWAKTSEDEKKEYQAKSQAQKKAVASSAVSKADSAEKKKAGVNAFKIFIERHREFYDKNDKFNDPTSNTEIGGYALTQKIWSNTVKKDKKMLDFYEKLKSEIDSGTTDLNKGMKLLPHIDFDKIREGSWTYEDLTLVD
jgi:hypothetical protein